MASTTAPSTSSWRTPAVVILCGCLVAMIGFGPRSALGLFLTPMSQANNWSREVFALALAIQNLLWGAGQPFAGALADKYGTNYVLMVGSVLYAAGIALMHYSTTPLLLDITAGVLIGFGLSCCSFAIVIGAFAKLLPERSRPMAFGLGTAAGSFGQFLFSPFGVAVMDAYGWQSALMTFAAVLLLIIPLSTALATPRKLGSAAVDPLPKQSAIQALIEACGHRSYVFLVLGFFTCGFQLAFVTVHLPAYLVDRGLSVQVGGWTLAIIGLFNIIGSILAGYLIGRMPKRYLLSIIYALRAASIVAFMFAPTSVVNTLIFGAVTGLLWLSTVPPTSALVAVMFGTRWMTMLFGFAFFSHQVGGFLGVLLGGIAFERTGSYDLVWWLSVLFGVLSALINLPIVERPVARPAVAAA
ncbi:MAG: MFS transporter [Pseudolabrys sp.]|nr:MFS transporter [Pseudolabrys sp.]MCW5686389.1 MFS transporter [Pseudolabrys sp.]